MSITGQVTGRVSRQYQDRAVEFLRRCNAFLLSDPPGAGKTLEVLSCVRPEAGPTLIVTNNSVKHFWVEEIHDWVGPQYTTVVYESWHVGDETFWTQQADFFLIHWEALPHNETAPSTRSANKPAPKRPRPERHFLTSRKWGTVILDEAHRAKNRNSQQSKIVRKVGARARYRYAVTASPIVNRPEELWAVLNFLHPKDFSSYWRYFNEEVLANKTPFGSYEILGWKNAKGMSATLSPYTVRRLKQTILPELPEKVHVNLPVVLSLAQRKAYDEMVKQFVTTLPNGKVVIAGTVLSQLTRLRQIACGLHLVGGSETDSCKLLEASAWVLNFLEENPDESVVMFSQFVPMCQAFAQRMEAAGYPAYLITGQTVKDSADRHAMVKGFQEGKRRVFVATTQTMGESATLTRASVVVFTDQLWSPLKQEQAEDRLHRLGQKKSVMVVVFEAANTVEQKVGKRLREKGEISGAVMDRSELVELLI